MSARAPLPAGAAVCSAPEHMAKAAPKAAWLVKSEPYKYPFAKLVSDGHTVWDGVRNFEARNNLRAMKAGDLALFYHSSEGKSVVGVARVKREAYADPTAKEGDWSAVDLAPEKALPKAITLEQIKRNAKLRDMALLRLSRLSVQPVTKAQFDEIIRMGGSRAPSRDVRRFDASGRGVALGSPRRASRVASRAADHHGDREGRQSRRRQRLAERPDHGRFPQHVGERP